MYFERNSVNQFIVEVKSKTFALILGCPEGIRKRKCNKVGNFPLLRKDIWLFCSQNVSLNPCSMADLPCIGANHFSLSNSKLVATQSYQHSVSLWPKAMLNLVRANSVLSWRWDVPMYRHRELPFCVMLRGTLEGQCIGVFTSSIP